MHDARLHWTTITSVRTKWHSRTLPTTQYWAPTSSPRYIQKKTTKKQYWYKANLYQEGTVSDQTKNKKVSNVHTLLLNVLIFLSTVILLFEKQTVQITHIVSNNFCSVKYYFDLLRAIRCVCHFHHVAVRAREMKGKRCSVWHFTSFQGA